MYVLHVLMEGPMEDLMERVHVSWDRLRVFRPFWDGARTAYQRASPLAPRIGVFRAF